MVNDRVDCLMGLEMMIVCYIQLEMITETYGLDNIVQYHFVDINVYKPL